MNPGTLETLEFVNQMKTDYVHFVGQAFLYMEDGSKKFLARAPYRLPEVCTALLKECGYKGVKNEVCMTLVRVLGDITFESDECCSHLLSSP